MNMSVLTSQESSLSLILPYHPSILNLGWPWDLLVPKSVVEMTKEGLRKSGVGFLLASIKKSVRIQRCLGSLLEGIQVSRCQSILCYLLKATANCQTSKWIIFSQHGSWLSTWPQNRLPSHVAKFSS